MAANLNFLIDYVCMYNVHVLTGPTWTACRMVQNVDYVFFQILVRVFSYLGYIAFVDLILD